MSGVCEKRRKLASLELEKLVDELSSGEGSVAALEELCALRPSRLSRPPQSPSEPSKRGVERQSGMVLHIHTRLLLFMTIFASL